MIANKNYAYDLSIAEPLRKEQPNIKKDFKVIKGNKKTVKKNVKSAKIVSKKSRASLIITTLSIFTMLIILSYRYNIISEKNLKIQRLNIEQEKVNSILTNTEISVSQTIDKNFIESYAKQQLGMQKPEKVQIVYINSDYDTKVNLVKPKNFLEKLINKIIK